MCHLYSFCHFFNARAPPGIYTLSLHELFRSLEGPALADVGRALAAARVVGAELGHLAALAPRSATRRDRKSTRLNSSHANISYAVFCLKKKRLYVGRDHITEQAQVAAGEILD